MALTPDELLATARSVVTKEQVEALMRLTVQDALDLDSKTCVQSRQFAGSLIFPKDTSKVEDTRFKAVAFCTFSEYNEIQKYKARIAELEAEIASMKGAS
jgi:hypothetical protein